MLFSSYFSKQTENSVCNFLCILGLGFAGAEWIMVRIDHICEVPEAG